MALEEQIVEWSRTRPPWQRAVLRRVATGDLLADPDDDQLVEEILASEPNPEVSFGLEQLPQAEAGDLPVGLVSIEKPEHVNALASEKALTFELNGLSIIYGDNARGQRQGHPNCGAVGGAESGTREKARSLHHEAPVEGKGRGRAHGRASEGAGSHQE